MHFHETVGGTRISPHPRLSECRRNSLKDADFHKVHNRLSVTARAQMHRSWPAWPQRPQKARGTGEGRLLHLEPEGRRLSSQCGNNISGAVELFRQLASPPARSILLNAS